MVGTVNGVFRDEADSKGILFGAAGDSSVSYDGTDYYAAIATYGSQTDATFNFGGSSFIHPVPDGYTPGFGAVG